MDAPILMPELVSVPGNNFIQKPKIGDAGNTFPAKSLVYITSGALAAVATAGVLCYGQTPDLSHAATEYPPQAFFGENHYVFSPLDGTFEINVGSLSANALVQGAANSAKTPGDVTVGTSYGIANPTAGAFIGFQVLDATNTTQLFFTVVGKVDGVADTDANGRVRAKIISSIIQN